MPDRATRAALALAAALGCGSASTPPAQAQPFDCEDVDHDCDPADRTVASGLKRVEAALVECARHAVDPCDLTFALAKVTDEQCRDAIECQVRALFAQVGDGGSRCVQQLFEEGYRFMSKNASWCRSSTTPPPAGAPPS